MSKLDFDVRKALTSVLITNLANATALAERLPDGVTHEEAAEAWREIADEIDRRLPQRWG